MQLRDPKLFRQRAYIDGAWVTTTNTLNVINPANQSLLGRVPRLESTEIRSAIEAAHRALPLWQNLTAKQRAKHLRRWYELVIQHQDDLAMILTGEQGKPLREAQSEIVYGASFIEWFAEEGKRVYGDVIPSTVVDQRLIVLKQAIGVVAAITPWNFPNAMITRKCAPALAAGCTVVVKPSELTPFSALALAELAERAGIPPGVFNVVTGEPEIIGHELTQHPSVRMLSFTGSTRVGQQLMQACSSSLKKVALECGGNAPFIIFDDADIDLAIEGAMASKFRNTGQTCICANRIFVQASIVDTFTQRLAQQVSALKVGASLTPDVQQGPLINQAALNKVEAHVQDALQKGATLVCGGKRHSLGGTFFEPTVLKGATSDMRLAQEETFGPIAAIFSFDSEAQVIQMANDTFYGLAAYLYSRDNSRLWRVAERLETGVVGLNVGIVSTEVAPMGGVKQSGIGREGSHYGIEEFLELKYLCMKI